MTEPRLGNTPDTLWSERVSTKQAWIATLARIHPQTAMTSLNHYLDVDLLRVAYNRTRKDGATGIDGQTAADYEQHLEDNLRDLLHRMKSGRYQAPPVKRAFVQKTDGSLRPLGIPTFEDKIAQRAVLMLLEPIYEQEFLDCSFGFRPKRSAHDALRTLRSIIMENRIRWVLDVDLQQYFDTIDHRYLREILRQRVVDGVVSKLIHKWLKAGVLEGTQWKQTSIGTPQGGVISPLLANIYLHHVLDCWFVKEVAPQLKGAAILVRYCDDFVLGFEDFLSARRALHVLAERLQSFGLSLHREKTRFVDFRFKRPDGQPHSACQGTTFDFLGFTHVWGYSRKGKPVIYQTTAKKRYARALKSVWSWCKAYRHRPIPEQHIGLCRRLMGHFAYFGITGNGRRIRWYARQVERIWRLWLSSRTRGNLLNWSKYQSILERHPLPKPRIVHQYKAPQANLSSEEPDA